jgi:hypothetical protein
MQINLFVSHRKLHSLLEGAGHCRFFTFSMSSLLLRLPGLASKSILKFVNASVNAFGPGPACELCAFSNSSEFWTLLKGGFEGSKRPICVKREEKVHRSSYLELS